MDARTEFYRGREWGGGLTLSLELRRIICELQRITCELRPIRSELQPITYEHQPLFKVELNPIFQSI